MSERLPDGLVCATQSCATDIHDTCSNCKHDFCRHCINFYACGGPTSSSLATTSQTATAPANFNMNSSIVASSVASFASSVANVPIVPPIVQSRAAFERNKKLAVEELLEQDSQKTLKYSTDGIVVPPLRFPLVEMPYFVGRSWVWEHFKKIVVKVGTQAMSAWADTNASCNICYARALLDGAIKWYISYTTAHSPGHLERHLKQCHNSILVDRRREFAEAEVEGTESIATYFVKYPMFEEKYLKWAVHAFQPLNTIEDPQFRATCQSLAPDCPLMTKVKVMKRLLQIEQSIKCVFRKALKEQYVSITLNHWTSNANVNYIAQTAHFITEEWKLTSFTLACSIHKGGSAGVNTREVSLLKHHHLLVSELIYF